VTFSGELGEYPAWFIPGDGPTWFVFVHGNGMTRRDSLRILPAIMASGMPALVPAYRGSEGAPDDPGGRLTYGKLEWRDLEAAVRYAIGQGAESVVIEGMSMGGGIAIAFLLESELAERVSGVVLDAPMLDFERTVEFQAEDEQLPLIGLPLPGTLVAAGRWMASLRFGVDWGWTHYLDRADELGTPMLLIHGMDDRSVPIATTEELARLRPDLVRDVYIVEGAGHVEGWNVDPGEYERRVLGFIAAVTGAR
jgi:pimeloyl-ACP methyl ester carboxylesterase